MPKIIADELVQKQQKEPCTMRTIFRDSEKVYPKLWLPTCFATSLVKTFQQFPLQFFSQRNRLPFRVFFRRLSGGAKSRFWRRQQSIFTELYVASWEDLYILVSAVTSIDGWWTKVMWEWRCMTRLENNVEVGALVREVLLKIDSDPQATKKAFSR